MMNTLERRLCQPGILLFLFGLLLGFAVPLIPNKQLILGAHETALQGGTFLIAMGLLWPKPSLSPRWTSLLAHLLWISFFVLESGLTLGAALGGDAAAGVVRSLVAALNAGGAILMLATILALIPALKRSGVASQTSKEQSLV